MPDLFTPKIAGYTAGGAIVSYLLFRSIVAFIIGGIVGFIIGAKS